MDTSEAIPLNTDYAGRKIWLVKVSINGISGAHPLLEIIDPNTLFAFDHTGAAFCSQTLAGCLR